MARGGKAFAFRRRMAHRHGRWSTTHGVEQSQRPASAFCRLCLGNTRASDMLSIGRLAFFLLALY